MTKDEKVMIDKFDGHDFGFWKIQIEDYLYQKNLHEPFVQRETFSYEVGGLRFIGSTSSCRSKIIIGKEHTLQYCQ